MPDTITDEGVARLRAADRRRPARTPHPPHYLVPNEDAFRHVAEAYGDDNPLWCDPAYAAATRWGGPIASPHLVGGDTLIGEDEVTELDGRRARPDEGRPAAAACTPSTPARSASGGTRSAPARASARRNALVGVHDKEGDFAGRAVHEWSAEVFAALDGPVLSAQYRLMIRAEREKADQPQDERRHRDRALHRRRDRARSTPPSPASATAGVGPSPAGGRTSPRATSSARW